MLSLYIIDWHCDKESAYTKVKFSSYIFWSYNSLEPNPGIRHSFFLCFKKTQNQHTQTIRAITITWPRWVLWNVKTAEESRDTYHIYPHHVIMSLFTLRQIAMGGLLDVLLHHSMSYKRSCLWSKNKQNLKAQL